MLAAVGVVIVLFSKKEKQRDWAQVLLGFAVLMFGMETMSCLLYTSHGFAQTPRFFRG